MTGIIDLSDTSLLCHLHHRSYYIMMSLCMCVCVCVCVCVSSPPLPTTVCSYCLSHATAATAKSLQSYLTLCNPTDSSPPGSCVPRILQAKTLQWVAISFSNMHAKSLQSCPTLCDPMYSSPPGSPVHRII